MSTSSFWPLLFNAVGIDANAHTNFSTSSASWTIDMRPVDDWTRTPVLEAVALSRLALRSDSRGVHAASSFLVVRRHGSDDKQNLDRP
jgi:hypothetical protein